MDHSNLTGEIVNKYGIGPQFAQAFLDYWFRDQPQVDHLHEILSQPPPAPVWFEYALTTNQRGQHVAQRFGEFLPPGARSYLDVGCAYGGCLRAFHEKGMQVRGFEIDPQLIELGQANCADANLYNCILQASILEAGLPDRLGGRFDVITCMAVLEHVLDIPQALHNLDDLLNPGGVLVIEIPSPTSLNLVANDIHFNLFGLVLLDRPDAVVYHRCFYPNEYDVGYIEDYTFYIRSLEQAGMKCRLVDSSVPMTGLRNARKILLSMRGFLRFLTYQAWKLPLWLNLQLASKYAQYVFTFMGDFLMVLLNKKARRANFQLKYFADVWHLVFEKPSTPI